MNIDELQNFQLWSQTWLEPSFLVGAQCYAGVQQRGSLLGDPTRLLHLEPSGGFRDSRCHELALYGYPYMNEYFPTFQHAQRRCHEEADQIISHRIPCTQSFAPTWPITQYTDLNPSLLEESSSERVFPSGKPCSADTKALYSPSTVTLRHNVSDTIQDRWDGDWSRYHVVTEQSAVKKKKRNRSNRRLAAAKHRQENNGNMASSRSKQYVCLFTIQNGTETPVCGQTFCRREHLKRHRNTVHCERKQWLCRIPGCEKLFSRADNLRDHYWTHLDKGNGAGRNAKWSLKELRDMLDTSAFLRLRTRLILYQNFNIDSSRRRLRRRKRGPS